MLDKVNLPDSACDISIFYLTKTAESTKTKNKRNGTITIDKVEQ